MWIYADESGNTGKDIFVNPQGYFSGTILSVAPIDQIVEPVLQRFRSEEQVAEIHASDLARAVGAAKVGEIGEALIDALDGATKWSFSATAIHKPYLATTKFVDTIFDNGENLAVRPQWYIHEFFRHAICCAIDDMLTLRNRERYWAAFLSGNQGELTASVRNALTYLDRVVKDRRLHTVIRDALQFAIRHVDQFTLPRGRRAYRDHTPNMVAFSTIMNAAHEFAKEHGVTPQAFYHDEQTEFGASMRESYRMFSRFRWRETGWMAMPEHAGYDLGKFDMPSSKSFPPLQAVDVLLWILARENKSGVEAVNEKLKERTDPNFISRSTSELICLGWHAKLARIPLTDQQLGDARLQVEGIERRTLDRVRDFAHSLKA
jgi:hypothetical protein